MRRGRVMSMPPNAVDAPPQKSRLGVKISGVLLKQPRRGLLKSYKRRWFELTEDDLSYKRIKKGGELLVSTPMKTFESATLVEGLPHGIRHLDAENCGFTVKFAERTFSLMAESPDKAKEWVAMLNACKAHMSFRGGMNRRISESGLLAVADLKKARHANEILLRAHLTDGDTVKTKVIKIQPGEVCDVILSLLTEKFEIHDNEADQYYFCNEALEPFEGDTPYDPLGPNIGDAVHVRRRDQDGVAARGPRLPRSGAVRNSASSPSMAPKVMIDVDRKLAEADSDDDIDEDGDLIAMLGGGGSEEDSEEDDESDDDDEGGVFISKTHLEIEALIRSFRSEAEQSNGSSGGRLASLTELEEVEEEVEEEIEYEIEYEVEYEEERAPAAPVPTPASIPGPRRPLTDGPMAATHPPSGRVSPSGRREILEKQKREREEREARRQEEMAALIASSRSVTPAAAPPPSPKRPAEAEAKGGLIKMVGGMRGFFKKKADPAKEEDERKRKEEEKRLKEDEKKRKDDEKKKAAADSPQPKKSRFGFIGKALGNIKQKVLLSLGKKGGKTRFEDLININISPARANFRRLVRAVIKRKKDNVRAQYAPRVKDADMQRAEDELLGMFDEKIDYDSDESQRQRGRRDRVVVQMTRADVLDFIKNHGHASDDDDDEPAGKTSDPASQFHSLLLEADHSDLDRTEMVDDDEDDDGIEEDDDVARLLGAISDDASDGDVPPPPKSKPPVKSITKTQAAAAKSVATAPTLAPRPPAAKAKPPPASHRSHCSSEDDDAVFEMLGVAPRRDIMDILGCVKSGGEVIETAGGFLQAKEFEAIAGRRILDMLDDQPHHAPPPAKRGAGVGAGADKDSDDEGGDDTAQDLGSLLSGIDHAGDAHKRPERKSLKVDGDRVLVDLDSDDDDDDVHAPKRAEHTTNLLAGLFAKCNALSVFEKKRVPSVRICNKMVKWHRHVRACLRVKKLTHLKADAAHKAAASLAKGLKRNKA